MSQDANGLLFLLGEDLTETLLTQSQLLAAGLRNPIFALGDLQSARSQLLELARDPHWIHSADPHLVILSLRDEFAALDFLSWLRARPELVRTIVLVLARPSRPQVLQKALNLGANLYHYHHLGAERLAATIRNLRFYNPQRALAGY